MAKRIAKLEVIKAGSNPDIDTDFRNDIRDDVIEHVAEVYGRDNVANIITFSTLAAKNAIKSLCTIYEIPFTQANKITSLIPAPIEGVECTIDDIFNPDSDRYNEAAEFRAAVSGSEWEGIIEGAKRIQNRVKGYGVHACGIIMSSKPLYETIPLMVRQDDGRTITQWTYPDCEAIGLIKYDFLGLKTVDIICDSVKYIEKNGKVAPNMVELVHGPMDDPDVYDLFSRGATTGIFQFGSPLVKDFCLTMKPTEFEDLAATTALLRPGPMGMLSHTRYAQRKNGLEKIAPIHKDFIGSSLDEILAKTYNLVVYQESILKIANQIAGMTLKEGDELRKAMGKKKKKVMDAMKPKFMQGGKNNGFSEEALNTLWDTISEFAKYGFNRAHSVAYAMTAYQTAYLKTHYPAEFMAALIAQYIDEKESTRIFIQDAQTMGLKIGTIDINASDIRVAPNYNKENDNDYDILFGISAAQSVSEDTAKIIVEEREKNGLYKSVQDCINRCTPLGVNNRRVYENLAYAGAFDCFGASRRGVVENIKSLMTEAKTKSTKGTSLFDLLSEDGETNSFEEFNLVDMEEFPYVKKLQLEANSVGLYLTGNPLSNIGKGLAQGGISSIKKLKASKSTATATIIGALTEIEVKNKRNKTIKIHIDDNTDLLEANVSKHIIKGIEKRNAQLKIEEIYTKSQTEVSDDIIATACDPEYLPVDELERNGIYMINVTYRPGFGDSKGGARVNYIQPLELTYNGSLPIRIRKSAKDEKEAAKFTTIMKKYAEGLSTKYPGDYPIYASIFLPEDVEVPEDTCVYYESLAGEIRELGIEKARLEKNNSAKVKKKESLFDQGVENDKKKVVEKETRELPNFNTSDTKILSEEELSYKLVYFDTGFTAEKSNQLEEVLSNKFGAERIDFGLFNQSMKEE